jgi:hypothetical protein
MMTDEIEKIIDDWGNETFFKGDWLDEDHLQDSIAWLYSTGLESTPQVLIFDSPLACQIELNRMEKKGLQKYLSSSASPEAWQRIKSFMFSFSGTEAWCNTLPVVKTAQSIARLSALDRLIIAHIHDAVTKRKIRFHKFSDDNLLNRFSKIVFYDYMCKSVIAAREGLPIKKAHGRVAGVNIHYLKHYMDFLRTGCFLSLFFQGLAMISRRPKRVRFDGSGRLHADGEAAIEWRDGWKLFYLNGVLVPEDVAVPPAVELDPGVILRESNVEVRREIVRKIGVERLIQKLGGKVIDSWRGYELIMLDIPGMGIKPTYLKMKNPSIGTYHVEGVPPRITTCRDALSWRVGGLKWNPKQLT